MEDEPPLLPLGTISVYNIQSADGYDDLSPLNLEDFVYYSVAQCGQETCIKPVGTDIANIKYFVVGNNTKLPEQRFDVVYDKEVRIYRDNEVFPRFFFVTEYEVITEPEAAITRARSPKFNARDKVVIDGLPQLTQPYSGESEVKIEVVSYQPMDSMIEVVAPTPGILVMSDTFYPGWAAYVDDQPTPIIRANGVMRAVELDEGHHFVRFHYAPESLKIGIYLSIGTLVVAVVLLSVSKLLSLSWSNSNGW